MLVKPCERCKKHAESPFDAQLCEVPKAPSSRMAAAPRRDGSIRRHLGKVNTMPIIRSGTQLIYFAHVPKCAGSAVEDHLTARFGAMALRDTRHLSRPANQRWTKTSPQHVDVRSLSRLFPEDFFDATFAVVRHPVSRLISAWHFQADVERTVPAGMTFSDWLEELPDWHESDPFLFDNHTRPMDDIVPRNAEIFHFEHGLDPIVRWLDLVTGRKEGPRTIGHKTPGGAKAGKKSEKVVPSRQDLETIARIHARDFERFGYEPDVATPLASPPEGPARAAEAPPAAPGLLNQVKRWVKP